MLMQEFIDSTGYTPENVEEYNSIEQEYYNFPGNKDAFCKAWKEEYEARMALRVTSGYPELFRSTEVAGCRLDY